MSECTFQDRREAGKVLGKLVAQLPDIADGVVLGLVRGGVPVAFEVAKACGLPLDIVVVRKLGLPSQPELAMGAIASGAAIVLNEEVLRQYRVSNAVLEQVIELERRELERREQLYRGGRTAIGIDGRVVVLVDDGVATGASMRVAIRAVKDRAKRVIVAVPVGAKSTCEELYEQASEVVCVLNPETLYAVSIFYREFAATSDQEVKELLREESGIRVRDSETTINKADSIT